LRQDILAWDSTIMPNDQVLRHFFAGELYQDHIIDPIVKWKFGNDYTEIEQRICICVATTPEETDFIFIRGRIDEMTFIKVEGVLVAIPNEAKTQRSGLNYLKEPRFEHMMQLMAYMGAIGAPYGKLIYMDRSTLLDKTFTVQYDPKLFKQILDRARIYHKFVLERGNNLPPAEALADKKTKWKCSNCPFKEICWETEGVTK
jgi:CRISPR/Cas system-associated exonuclease Cas4 (RecB family)